MGSKNMLLDKQEYLQRQRALENQPKMFDQAYIMRVHQTARSGVRGHKDIKQGPTADLPLGNLFP